MEQVCNWGGYQFTVYPQTTSWNDTSGIYIFAGLAPGGWVALYIGQASSFRARLSAHEQWQKAYALGATHVHALVVPSVLQRDSIERSLIVSYQPRLNQQLK